MDTNNNNQNNGVNPQPMPAYPGNQVYPTQMPLYPDNSVNPTMMNQGMGMPMQGMDMQQPEMQMQQPEMDMQQPEMQMQQPEMDMPQPEVVSPGPEVVSPQPEVAPTLNSEDVTVISTNHGKKGGGAAVIVIALFLVLFVFNIDKVEDIFNNYVKENILFNKNANKGENLNGGFIQVDDPNSFDTLNSIKFYNFNTTTVNNALALNYKSDIDIQNASAFNIYIEVYDTDKDLIYKNLFDPKKEFKKNTAKEYDINLPQDVFEKIKYAKIKNYSEKENDSTSKVTCTLIEETNKYNLSYKNVYNFKNNVLLSYDVTEEIISKEGFEEDAEVKEYKTNLEKAKDELIELTPAYQDGKLTYIVDTSKDYTKYKLVETMDSTPKMVRIREEKKKWKCE